MKRHPEVDVMINFASLRSAYDSSIEALQFPQVSCDSVSNLLFGGERSAGICCLACFLSSIFSCVFNGPDFLLISHSYFTIATPPSFESC
jgi:hypothetical protein